MITPVQPEERARLEGKLVIASVSGGKDSAAMSLWLTANGIEHRRVFMDTGWEHPKTYEYLRDVLPKHIGPIEWITPLLQMEDLIRKKGMFPSRQKRFCTQQLKVFPFQRYLESLDEDVVNVVGIRAAESAARASMVPWEHDPTFDAFVWRPLLSWKEDDVIEQHRKAGLPPNPLYLIGASRVGCWPCIYARKSEIRMVADLDPERIDRIRALEEEVTTAAAARAAAKGEALRHPPAFFQSRTGSRLEDGALVHNGYCVPIDDVVEWSKTSRGGKQFEMFADPADGCMRWGMCDTQGDETPVK